MNTIKLQPIWGFYDFSPFSSNLEAQNSSTPKKAKPASSIALQISAARPNPNPHLAPNKTY